MRGAPGHLLLLNQFQKYLNCLLLIGKQKKILANQQRGAAGDWGVFLHDIGFLIDHHCCVVRLTGEVSGGKFQKKTVNKAGKVCKGGGAGNVCKGVESGSHAGADLGGGCWGCAPPLLPEITTGILQKKKNFVVYWC